VNAELLNAFGERITNAFWRISSGVLYKIIDKNADEVDFIPNVAQLEFLEAIHYRNVIPKARQRGLSTVIQILMLDSALFTDNFKGLVIAQDEDAAQSIFRDKLKFAYNHLPPPYSRNSRYNPIPKQKFYFLMAPALALRPPHGRQLVTFYMFLSSAKYRPSTRIKPGKL